MPSVENWARQQWGTVELGDKRRTERAVRIGAQMAACPQASLPGPAQTWGDLQAAYRLLHGEEVTHQALSLPHWRATHRIAEQADGPVLLVQDGAQLDFTFRNADGSGRIGNNKGSGLLIHCVLAVQPGKPAAVGSVSAIVKATSSITGTRPKRWDGNACCAWRKTDASCARTARRTDCDNGRRNCRCRRSKHWRCERGRTGARTGWRYCSRGDEPAFCHRRTTLLPVLVRH